MDYVELYGSCKKIPGDLLHFMAFYGDWDYFKDLLRFFNIFLLFLWNCMRFLRILAFYGTFWNYLKDLFGFFTILFEFYCNFLGICVGFYEFYGILPILHFFLLWILWDFHRWRDFDGILFFNCKRFFENLWNSGWAYSLKGEFFKILIH